MKKIFSRYTGANSIQESIWDAEAKIEMLERSKRMNSVARSAYQSIAWEISRKYKLINPIKSQDFEENLRNFAR